MTPEELVAASHDYLKREDSRPQILKDLTAPAPTCLAYLRFFYELALQLKPSVMLETGTDRGRSAAHLALGNPAGLVITIDIDQTCKNNVDALSIKNIESHATDALAHVAKVPDGALDLLFLDSLHEYGHVTAEWKAYQRKVRKGGLAFFDDIHLDPGMDRFWSEVQGTKVDISHLHFSGFGAVLL